MTRSTFQFALSFPQGHIIFIQNGGAYFLPLHTMDAFQVYGERKELFGKKAITVRGQRENGVPEYSVVYEFSAAQTLCDARLVSGEHTVHGTLADQDFMQSLNGALAQNALKLYTTQDTQPDTIFNVARFADGRYLIQMSNSNTLYLGTPGNYEKLQAKLVAQGGSSMYYRDIDGGDIALPWGMSEPRYGQLPNYKGEDLNYVKIRQDGNPAEFGLIIETKLTHLSPFHPQLKPAGVTSTTKPPQP